MKEEFKNNLKEVFEQDKNISKEEVKEESKKEISISQDFKEIKEDFLKEYNKNSVKTVLVYLVGLFTVGLVYFYFFGGPLWLGWVKDLFDVFTKFLDKLFYEILFMKKFLMILVLMLCLVACGGGDPKTSADIKDGTKVQIVGAGVDLDKGNGYFVIKYNNKYGLADIDDSDAMYIFYNVDNNGMVDINLFGMDTKFIKWDSDLNKLDDWAESKDITIEY